MFSLCETVESPPPIVDKVLRLWSIDILYITNELMFTHSGVVRGMQLGTGAPASRSGEGGSTDDRGALTHLAVIKELILKQKFNLKSIKTPIKECQKMCYFS